VQVTAKPSSLWPVHNLTHQCRSVVQVTARRNIFPWASKWRAKTDGAAVAYALRAGGPVANVFGPVAFDAKGDANGMTYEMNVWRDAR
jgi:ABC-type branched-subunit amino acid transport system substrate-binding protein